MLALMSASARLNTAGGTASGTNSGEPESENATPTTTQHAHLHAPTTTQHVHAPITTQHAHLHAATLGTTPTETHTGTTTGRGEGMLGRERMEGGVEAKREVTTTHST